MKRLATTTLLALATAAAAAAPVNPVSYDTLAGTQRVDFDDLTGGPDPGTQYAATFVSRGVGFGERFAGQAVTPAFGRFDQLAGLPAGGVLTLLAGAAAQNLSVANYRGSNTLAGLGPLGYPSFSAQGEGAFALLFSSDQSEFGFQLVGGNGGSATIDFFRADGSLIHTYTATNLAEAYYGFAREGGVRDIRGISVWNTDPGGMGIDNIRHDVPSAVPEPATAALLLAGLLAAGAAARRRRLVA